MSKLMHNSNQGGFSFIELILTIFLLSMVLATASTFMQSSVSNSHYSKYYIQASQIGEEKLEAIMADRFFQGYDYIDTANYPDESLVDPYNGFSTSIDIYEVNNTDLTTPESGTNFKKVDVTISNANDGFDAVTLSTLVSNYGT